MEKIRALVRPIVTVLVILTLSGMVYQGMDVPEFYIGLASGLLAWWFSDRTQGKKPPAP